jgi:cell division protein FtsZ
VAKDAGFFESFRIADDVLRQGVQGISDIITIPGIINRDFADVKTTMAGMGYAVMGTAVATGQDRALAAARQAMASPLLESGAIDGARGILINITGSSSLKLSEVNAASTIIQSAAHEDANIIFGAVLDESMKDAVKITVIATGFRNESPQRREKMIGLADESIEITTERLVPVRRAVSTQETLPPFASQVAAAGEQASFLHSPAAREEEFFSGSEAPDGFAGEPDAAPEASEPQEVRTQASRQQQPETRENIDIPAFLRRGGPGY